MRWGVPDSRLTQREQIDELLARAAEDWLDPTDIFDVARFAGCTDEEAYVEQAVTLVTELILQRLVVPGDLTRDGFQPWALEARAATERIAEAWHDDHEAAPSSFFVWLESTAEGEERGRRAWLVDRPIDD